MTNFIVTDDGSSKIISKLAFRRLFTLEERIVFDNIDSNEALTALQKSTIKTLQNDMTVATYIDLEDPDTIDGVNYLEAVGVIASGRANEILSS